MEKFNVYVVEKSYNDYSIEDDTVREAGGRLLFANCRNEQDVIEQCADAHALLLRQTPVGERVIKNLPNLQVISRYGVGYDNVDVQAAIQYGVAVTIVPDYCVGEVADHTAALLLSSIRKIPIRDRFVRQGRWDFTSKHPVNRTRNKILGLVGYGKTAREVRKRLSGFPFRFVACDPFVSDGVFESDKTLKLDFDKLIMVSDYVSIHVPLNEGTYHMFNLPIFRKMRRGAVIVNTSRGQVVDMKALYTALIVGFISGAALDVYENEPFNGSNPLSKLDNVILSDHSAWYSVESQKELQLRTVLEAVRVLRGEMPENPVNPEVLSEKSYIEKTFVVEETKEILYPARI